MVTPKKRLPRKRVPAANSVETLVKKKNTARRKADTLGTVLTVKAVPAPKSKSQIEVEVMTLDPAFAQELLENTPKTQRKLRKSLMDKYASDMLAGRWRPTGAPIRLNADLELIDGQHRCAACVKSGVSLPDTVIQTLFDARAFDAIDQGAVRSLTDVVRMAGITPAGPKVMAGVMYEYHGFKTVVLSKPEQLQVITTFPDIAQVKRVCSQIGVSAGMVAAYIRAAKKDADKATLFFTAAFSNKPIIGTEFCDNASVLSNWILQVKSRRSGKTGEPWKRESCYRCLQAWNAWRRGKILKTLMYDPNQGMIDAV